MKFQLHWLVAFEKKSIRWINADQLASRLRRGLSCCVARTQAPEDRGPSAKSAVENTENTESISAENGYRVCNNTYMYAHICTLCVRAQRAHSRTSEKFFHRSDENCVGMVNGRHERTGPISYAGRTHPVYSDEK